MRAVGLKGEAAAVSAEFPLIGRPVEDRRAGEKFRSLRGPHTRCFNATVSIGSFRARLPVAAKIALVTAGTMAEVPGSPIPPGGAKLWTMWTSIAGAGEAAAASAATDPAKSRSSRR